jgi:hypothetical protein
VRAQCAAPTTNRRRVVGSPITLERSDDRRFRSQPQGGLRVAAERRDGSDDVRTRRDLPSSLLQVGATAHMQMHEPTSDGTGCRASACGRGAGRNDGESPGFPSGLATRSGRRLGRNDCLRRPAAGPPARQIPPDGRVFSSSAGEGTRTPTGNAHQDLNLARLPVPPRPPERTTVALDRGRIYIPG